MNRSERLRSLGVLFTIVAVVIIFFGYSANDLSRIYGNNPLWSVLFGLLLLSIIALTFFWGSIDEYYKDKKNKKNELSNTVISKRTSVIHILDTKGENASYFEKVLFYKIDKKNPYISDIFADETNPNAYISNPQLANCTTNYAKKITHLEISFKDNMEELNEVQSSYKVDKFLYVSVELKNCFTNTTRESWQIKIKNYCKEVEQEITFPAGKFIEQVKLYKIEDNKETVVTAVTPIIIREDYLYLTNLDKNECFDLRWTYAK
jgi:hypothetical protein